jgi:hypothetical protein
VVGVRGLGRRRGSGNRTPHQPAAGRRHRPRVPVRRQDIRRDQAARSWTECSPFDGGRDRIGPVVGRGPGSGVWSPISRRGARLRPAELCPSRLLTVLAMSHRWTSSSPPTREMSSGWSAGPPSSTAGGHAVQHRPRSPGAARRSASQAAPVQLSLAMAKFDGHQWGPPGHLWIPQRPPVCLHLHNGH